MTHRCGICAAERFYSQGSNDAHETKKNALLVEAERQVNNRNLKAMLCCFKDVFSTLHPHQRPELWTACKASVLKHCSSKSTICAYVASVFQ